jgi:hypothetical protein
MMTELCVYCNQSQAQDIDHVIPRAFYRKSGSASNSVSGKFYLKVPVCKSCNNKKSLPDESFRNIVVLTCAHKHQLAAELFDTVIRSIEKNKIYQDSLKDENIEKIVVNETGEKLIQFYSPYFKPLDYLTDYCARGIYYLETKKRLHLGYDIRIKQLDPLDKKTFDKDFEWVKTNGFKIREENDQIFQYIHKSEKGKWFLFLSFFMHENFLISFIEPP